MKISKVVHFKVKGIGRIGNHAQAIECYQFRLPWVISDCISRSQYFQNQISQKHCWTLLGSYMQSVECCLIQWLWLTPNPGFKRTVLFEGNILKMVHFSCCRTLMEKTYRTVPVSMALFECDLWSGFQGRSIFRCQICQKRCMIEP